MGGKPGNRRSGAGAYERWLKEAARKEVVALPGPGPYRRTSWLLGAGDVKSAKKEIVGGIHLEDFADYLGGGNTPSVLDLTRSYGKHFDFGPASGGFDTIFPGCIPIAVSCSGEDEGDEGDEYDDFEDDEEFFYFIDTRRASYPVLYWEHDTFAVIASDLASFLAEMKRS